jgi:hypothetical protein
MTVWHAPVTDAVQRLVLSVAAVALFAATGVDAQSPTAGEAELAKAERLIDAFYSFDAARLSKELADAPKSSVQILYYQGWAEGGNYVVLKREPCRLREAGQVTCHITVKDDLIGALRTGYDVTDAFHLTFRDGRIVRVQNTSNDPPQMKQAFEWLRGESPDIFSGPCQAMFAGGKTPQACVRAFVKGFTDFTNLAGQTTANAK